MIASPMPSTCTTGPWAEVIFSSRLSVPAARIWSSSVERVERRVIGRCSLVVVFEIAPETSLRFDVEDDAGVDRPRVDVHRDGTLVPLGEVADAVDGLGLVDGVQRAARHRELVLEVLHLQLGR